VRRRSLPPSSLGASSRSSLCAQLEGFTFYYYLEHHTLPTLEQAQASLFPPAPPADAPSSSSADPSAAPDAAPAPTSAPAPAPAPAPEPYFHVTVDDYLGGVADLTGELMRLAIASVGKNLTESLVVPGSGSGDDSKGEGKGKGFADIEHIGRLVREIQAGASAVVLPFVLARAHSLTLLSSPPLSPPALRPLSPSSRTAPAEMTPLAAYARWLPKKLTVLDQSLAKIENGASPSSLSSPSRPRAPARSLG